MISDLLPEVQKAANRAFDRLRKKKIPFSVTSDFRFTWLQIILYMQKRAPLEIVNLWRRYFEQRLISEKENERMVTKCDGLTKLSNHQGRRAVDVVPAEGGKAVWPAPEDPRWKEIAKVMKEEGFSWGGDWIDPDYPHYEYLG